VQLEFVGQIGGIRATSAQRLKMSIDVVSPSQHNTLPRVSIVIVTHNSSKYLERCLSSLYSHHDNSQLEVIVVDNESIDGTAASLAHSHPETYLIVMPQSAIVGNSGASEDLALSTHSFAAANNQGLALARGRYLVLLNPDTIFHEPTCSLVADYLDAHPTVGAAACQLRNPDGSIQPSCRSFPSIGNLFWTAILIGGAMPPRLRPNNYRMRFWRHDAERSVDQPAGAFLMVRRTVVDQVGPLDEQFRLYYEDVDWCYRIKAAGWPIMFWPGTSIVHIGGGSTHPIYASAVRQMHLSMLIYFRKHYGSRAATEARFLSLVSVLSHTAFWAVKYVIMPTQRQVLTSMIGAHVKLLTFEISRLLWRSQSTGRVPS
jgi:GT2 family glycosyltransferase